MDTDTEPEPFCSRCGKLEEMYGPFFAGYSWLTFADAANAAKLLSTKFECDFSIHPTSGRSDYWSVTVSSDCVYRIIEERAPGILFDHLNYSSDCLRDLRHQLSGVSLDCAIDQALQFKKQRDLTVMLVYDHKGESWGFASEFTEEDRQEITSLYQGACRACDGSGIYADHFTCAWCEGTGREPT